ncbi:dihydrofolate reductase [Martelella soudanensis]|uniref:dihydrofolate reductase n=1 Tax=unclassified Martelella TaxID=2629616 RepID=UPI0015DDFCC4|nr:MULTISPECIES: dihydrofolate reductase [unclassified Martelella]
MNKIDIVLIAAVAENGVIGRAGDMPWHLASDFKRFRAITMGKPQIMGRKTFASIGKPLPGRTNIVVSRDPGLAIEGCLTAATLEDALALAKADAVEKGMDEICIQGGGEIYRQAIHNADRLRITHVETALEGDTTFPEIDPALWKVTEEERLPAGEKDDYPTCYKVYERRR